MEHNPLSSVVPQERSLFFAVAAVESPAVGPCPVGKGPCKRDWVSARTCPVHRKSTNENQPAHLLLWHKHTNCVLCAHKMHPSNRRMPMVRGCSCMNGFKNL